MLAYDEETGEQAYKPVVQLFRNESKDWTGVTVNGKEIISTPGHKYYLPETKAWVSAEDLKIGDEVLTSDGEYATIEAVRPIHYETPQTTYNFEVEGFHTYYVSIGVLVHNKGCGVNQMNEEIKKGKAPKGVDRIDRPKIEGEQIHAHFNKGSAINIDGSLKHGTGKELTQAITKWLRKNGWKI